MTTVSAEKSTASGMNDLFHGGFHQLHADNQNQHCHHQPRKIFISGVSIGMVCVRRLLCQTKAKERHHRGGCIRKVIHRIGNNRNRARTEALPQACRKTEAHCRKCRPRLPACLHQYAPAYSPHPYNFLQKALTKALSYPLPPIFSSSFFIRLSYYHITLKSELQPQTTATLHKKSPLFLFRNRGTV